jgi:hypothetical protein
MLHDCDWLHKEGCDVWLTDLVDALQSTILQGCGPKVWSLPPNNNTHTHIYNYIYIHILTTRNDPWFRLDLFIFLGRNMGWFCPPESRPWQLHFGQGLAAAIASDLPHPQIRLQFLPAVHDAGLMIGPLVGGLYYPLNIAIENGDL